MQLQEATNETDLFHGNDINIAYQVLGYLLRHESKQVGLNVTATIMKSFTKVGKQQVYVLSNHIS